MPKIYISYTSTMTTTVTQTIALPLPTWSAGATPTPSQYMCAPYQLKGVTSIFMSDAGLEVVAALMLVSIICLTLLEVVFRMIRYGAEESTVKMLNEMARIRLVLEAMASVIASDQVGSGGAPPAYPGGGGSIARA